MIRITGLLIFVLALVELANAQNPYYFKEIKIWINSPISFNATNIEKLNLETDGLKVQFSPLGGMEGISGLVGSLENYDGSFGFQSFGKAYQFKLKNLQAARIDANNNGQSVILAMVATNDYQYHFICEIYFSPNKKNEAEVIVQSIYYNESSDEISNTSASINIIEESTNNENTSETVTSTSALDLPIAITSPNSTIKDTLNYQTRPVKNTHLNGTPIEKITWRLLSTYSPDGYIILDDYLKAPSEYDGATTSGDSDFKVWIEGTSEKDIVNSANTVVHEMCHGYTSKLYLKLLKDEGKPIADGDYSAFYLGNHVAKLVKHTDVYITDEINSIFPDKLKTSRYQTYIYPSDKDLGSQQDGCYGLLDELNAYYWGTRTSYDLYNYFKDKYNTQQGWSNFFSDFYGTSYAYLEFKSYILYYLMYAKENHKEIYDGIIANKDFLEAFQKVDDNWWKLITNFRILRQNFIAEQKKKGIAIKEEGGFLYFGSNGTGNFSEIYNLFRSELSNEKYQSIARACGLKSSSAPELFN